MRVLTKGGVAARNHRDHKMPPESGATITQRGYFFNREGVLLEKDFWRGTVMLFMRLAPEVTG